MAFPAVDLGGSGDDGLDSGGWEIGRRTRIVVLRAVVMVAALLGFAALSHPVASAAGWLPSGQLAGCAGAWSASGASPRVLVIDCTPGFASPHDRIAIYPRAPIQPDADWRDGLNMTDSVWVFDAGSTGQASLVIDFHPNLHGPGVVADLYDDQDGDGRVTLGVRNGIPFPAELQFPTVRVIAPDGWWMKDGRVNFNLDLAVDGPVYAAFNSDVYLSRLQTDGRPDFEITVRDTHGNGRPDFEWINAWPDAPEGLGILRSEVMVNTAGNEHPITDSLFWPYLGTALTLPVPYRGTSSIRLVGFRAGRSPNPQSPSYGFVKEYGQSFPPIQVYWPAAKIAYVGEFVASRGNRTNWFLYSVNRLTPQDSYANFENPFAFYDLANADDGYPDLAIRNQYSGPNDPSFYQGRFPNATDLIRYSWDQLHQHQWDYKVDLIGQHTIDSVIHLPGLAVRTVPYARYPLWVVERRWDVADFVAVEKPRYWTTEGVYDEIGATLDVRDTYLTGVRSTPPKPDDENWPVNFRGEFNLDFHDQPRLYFSPVDHKLHLLKAQAGLWKLGSAEEIRYENLGGDYLDKWSLVEDGTVAKSLTFVDSQLVLADAGGVYVKTVDVPPARFTALPPTDHDTWARLRDLIQQDRGAFAADDFRAMFDQFPGSVQELAGATLSDFRVTPNGFRFALRLLSAVPPGVPWASGLQPGAYLVHYRTRSGYSAEPLRPATLQLSPITIVGQRPTALQPITLETTVQNLGNVDCSDVPVRFTASRAGQPAKEIGSVTVTAPGDGSVQARLTWSPPSSGRWLIQAATTAGTATSSSIEVAIAAPPRADLRNLLVVSGLSERALAIVGTLLGSVVLSAAAFGIVVWRSGLESR